MSAHHSRVLWIAQLLFTSIGAAIGAESPENTTDLPPVVVVPTVEESAGLVARSEANAVTSVTQRQLESSQYANVNTYLRGTPGIISNRSSEGFSTGLKLRGATAGQGMVTLDGVPLLTSLPGLSWLDSIPAESLGGVTVVSGSDHAFYTGQSLGGAIRLSSKQARDNALLGTLEGGTFGTMRETLGGGLAGPHGHISLTGSRFDQFDGAYDAIPQRGNPERDPVGSTLGISRYGTQFNENLDLQGTVLYKDSRLSADGPDPTFRRVGIFDDPTTYFHEKLVLAQDTLSAKLTDDWTSQVQLAFTHNEVDARGLRMPFGFRSNLMFVDWRNTHGLFNGSDQNWRLVWGGQGRYEQAEASAPRPKFRANAERSTSSGFAELQADIGAWRHEAGVRVESYSDYDTHTLVHFGSRWNISPNLLFRANTGTTYRAPSYGELYMPLLGNNKLKPEQGLTADAGFEWNPTRLFRASVTGYYGRYSNLTVTTLNLGRFYSFENTRRARIVGAETSMEFIWSDDWRNGLDFTYQHAENLDNGMPLAVHPERTGRAWLQWNPVAFPVSVRMNATYRSVQYHDQQATLRNGDAVRLDILADYRFSRNLDVYVRGENLNNCKTGDFFGRYAVGPTVYGGVHVNF